MSNNPASNITHLADSGSKCNNAVPTSAETNSQSLAEVLNATDFAVFTDPNQLAQPILPPIERATFKSCPEHFIVNEQLDIDFTEEGEHLWLLIKKTGMNTAHTAQLLADWAGIPIRDIGYSGLKDRQAVTTQWFSLRIPNRTLPETIFAPNNLPEHEQVEILDQHWHNKKLNRGTHKSNQFIITLTDVQYEDIKAVEQCLQHISEEGVPNYFGAQRFGHYGNNISEALKWFSSLQDSKDGTNAEQRGSDNKSRSTRKGHHKRRISKRQREQQSMLLSAARSLIFNKILDARVKNATWNSGLLGEVYNLAGTGSIFTSDTLSDELIQRLRIKDIHPTAVLWGTNNDQVAGAAPQLERSIIEEDLILSQLAQGLETHGIKAQRRALRLMPQELSWRWPTPQSLELQFSLTTGSYATSVLASLVNDIYSS